MLQTAPVRAIGLQRREPVEPRHLQKAGTKSIGRETPLISLIMVLNRTSARRHPCWSPTEQVCSSNAGNENQTPALPVRRLDGHRLRAPGSANSHEPLRRPGTFLTAV